VAEYMTVCYAPSIARHEKLAAAGLQAATRLASWRRGVARGWGQVRVSGVESNGCDPMHVGGEMKVKARVNLGTLTPDDVQVQLVYGPVDNTGEIARPATLPMKAAGPAGEGGAWVFEGTIPCKVSGQQGYCVRVLPRHADLANAFEPGLVCWG
jgi:starch phosphorylase